MRDGNSSCVTMRLSELEILIQVKGKVGFHGVLIIIIIYSNGLVTKVPQNHSILNWPPIDSNYCPL